MSDAYKRAAARLEAEKKADQARKNKAAKSVKKVSRPKPVSKNPAKSGRSSLSTLAAQVRKEMAKYRTKKKVAKKATTRTKQIEKNVGSALTKSELDRFRRKK